MGGKVKWQYCFNFVGKRREIKGVVQVIKDKIGNVDDKNSLSMRVCFRFVSQIWHLAVAVSMNKFLNFCVL